MKGNCDAMIKEIKIKNGVRECDCNNCRQTLSN